MEDFSENENLVNVEFLNRQSEMLITWGTKIEKDFFCEKELKRSLRATEIKEEEFDLIFCHL